jgi:hypothetical protein
VVLGSRQRLGEKGGNRWNPTHSKRDDDATRNGSHRVTVAPCIGREHGATINPDTMETTTRPTPRRRYPVCIGPTAKHVTFTAMITRWRSRKYSFAITQTFDAHDNRPGLRLPLLAEGKSPGVGAFPRRSSLVILERACSALAALVRKEYPDDYSLADIADIWGDATPEQVEALNLLEAGIS